MQHAQYHSIISARFIHIVLPAFIILKNKGPMNKKIPFTKSIIIYNIILRIWVLKIENSHANRILHLSYSPVNCSTMQRDSIHILVKRLITLQSRKTIIQFVNVWFPWADIYKKFTMYMRRPNEMSFLK